jgi:glyoxylase-like metal-dependent hydrolase (beta-lactamase superfamily II)
MRVVVDGHVGHGPEHYGYRAPMRLLALRCGDIRTDPGLLLDGKRSEQTFDIPVMTHAIDTGDGVLVWDTGMNARCLEDLAGYLGSAMASTFHPLGGADTLAPARLRQAGFSDDDVRWVVNSHLHFDHCGCNSSFLPAKWVIRAREVAFYRSKLGHPAFGLGPDDLGPEDPAPFDYEDQHDLLGDGSLVLLDTRGHTPGHQSLLVTFADGRRYVLVGDAAYTRDAIDAGQPQGRPWNLELAVEAIGRLKALEDSGATLLLAHDSTQWTDVADVADVHAA